MPQAIRQRSGFGGRTTGPVNAAFICPSQVAAAANPWNTFYFSTPGAATFSETNQRYTATLGGTESIIGWTGFGGGSGDRAIEFEFVVAGGATAMRVGFTIGPVPAGPATSPGNETGGFAYNYNGEIIISSAVVATVAGLTTGDKVTLISRFSAGTVEAWKNGSTVGIWSVGANRYYYPGAYANGGTTGSIRIATTPSYAVPAAYWI